MSEAILERRKLKMHPKLLLDVIRKQAGSIYKSILEGVMNACEAGASKVDINFVESEKVDIEQRHKATIHIFDDGQGIPTIEEIDKYFDTFGTPHEESEHKTWAQFRMGRGQMFAFGKNTWRTSTFKMIVDVKENGLDYDLEKDLPAIEGCQITIELYHNPIGDWDNRSIDALKANIQKQVMFMEVPILFNGEQVNTPASQCKWDSEDENAYYLFNVGSGIRIYNLGAYAKEETAYKVGCTGVVVSKKRLDINFARNDIMATCPVYQAIQEVFKQNRKTKTRKARTMIFTEAERVSALLDLRDGQQEYDELKNIKLLPTANHRLVTLEQIRKIRTTWTFAEDGDRVADRAMQYEQVLCLSDRLPGLLDYTGKEADFFNWLCRYEIKNGTNTIRKSWDMVKSFYISSIKLREGISETYQLISDKKQTKVERRILKILNELGCWEGRIIRIGQTDICSAWTDGSSYITIDRGFLQHNPLDYPYYAFQLFALLCHELAHDENTAGTHVHGSQFFERFHEIIMNRNGSNPMYWVGNIPSKMRSALRKEREEVIIAKQKKEEEKIAKKLGVNNVVVNTI